MLDKTILDKITDEVFQLDNPVINSSRRSQIREFIESAINGDTPESYLVINSKLSKDRKGVLVYILTNARLLKIDIDDKDIYSSSPSLNAIINIDRKLLEGNRAQVTIYFQNDSFGLKYSADNQKISEFFQKVDQWRIKGKS